MAFPSANLSDLTIAWAVIRNTAADIKRKTVNLANTAAVTNVSGEQIITYLQELVALRVNMQTYVNTPGLLAYVRDQINNPSIDIAAEWNVMNQEIADTIAWVIANFPKDAEGYLLYHKLDANGVRQLRVFTPTDLTGLVTQLNTLAATIA